MDRTDYVLTVITPLFRARVGGNGYWMKLLAEGKYQQFIDEYSYEKVNINHSNDRKWTILHYASMCAFKEGLKILFLILSHPDLDVNKQTKDGWTALMLACRNTNTYSGNQVVDLLLLHPKINVNLVNDKGKTALIYAANFSRTTSSEKTVQKLLDRPEIDVNVQDSNGMTALMYAVKFSNYHSTGQTVKMLLDHAKINIDLRDNYGNSIEQHCLSDHSDDRTRWMIRDFLYWSF